MTTHWLRPHLKIRCIVVKKKLQKDLKICDFGNFWGIPQFGYSKWTEQRHVIIIFFLFGQIQLNIWKAMYLKM